MLNCKDGMCEATPHQKQEGVPRAFTERGRRIIYVNDPMCSWCYGISEIVTGLQAYCDKKGIGFEMMVGGLRSGGPESWSAAQRQYLREVWSRITRVTEQSFNFKILDLEYFDYDTTPSCRAIVVAKKLLPADNGRSLVQFLHELQKKFYLRGEDPKEVDFYRSICEQFKIDFEQFTTLFLSDEIKEETLREFNWCAAHDATLFPTFLWIDGGDIRRLASGYTSLDRLVRRIPLVEAEERGAEIIP